MSQNRNGIPSRFFKPELEPNCFLLNRLPDNRRRQSRWRGSVWKWWSARRPRWAARSGKRRRLPGILTPCRRWRRDPRRRQWRRGAGGRRPTWWQERGANHSWEDILIILWANVKMRTKAKQQNRKEKGEWMSNVASNYHLVWISNFHLSR